MDSRRVLRAILRGEEKGGVNIARHVTNALDEAEADGREEVVGIAVGACAAAGVSAVPAVRILIADALNGQSRKDYHSETLIFLARTAYTLIGYEAEIEHIALTALGRVKSRSHAFHECHQLLGELALRDARLDNALAHQRMSTELESGGHPYPFLLGTELMLLLRDARCLVEARQYCSFCLMWIANNGDRWGDPRWFVLRYLELTEAIDKSSLIQ
jgi:hypothetical protein